VIKVKECVGDLGGSHAPPSMKC